MPCASNAFCLISLFCRESFPNDLQFSILMRFTVDQTQTPSLKVRIYKSKLQMKYLLIEICFVLLFEFVLQKRFSLGGFCFYKLSDSQASAAGPASLFLELQGFLSALLPFLTLCKNFTVFDNFYLYASVYGY